MKTVLFFCETEVGTFWIQPQPDRKVALCIDRTQLNTYRSPSYAAEKVAKQETGYEPWDSLPEVKVARDLKGWKKGAGRNQVREKKKRAKS